MKIVPVLFARADSIYKELPGTDVFDRERDATTWESNSPCIAHPPCRAWGQLRTFANPRPGEKELAPWAIEKIRQNGGVLEHPKNSTLWEFCNLPTPGRTDQYGGFTLGIHQREFGHRAEKPTLLYIVGITPEKLPPIPLRLDYPTHVIQSRKRTNSLPHTSKAEREHTPRQLAEWLIEIARRIRPD